MPIWIKAVAGVVGVGLLAGAGMAKSDFRLERELELSNSGRFELSADVGAVEIIGDREQGVSILITAKNADLGEYLTFDFTSRDDLARVRARRTDQSARGDVFRGLKFVVRVPSAALVEARTAGGAMAIEQLGADADIRTSGGAIKVAGVAGDLLAATSGGSIEVEGVTGEVRVRTSGGSLRLEDLAEYVEASTSGGSIRATFTPGNQRGGVLRTSAGAIDVALDPRANLTINARTSAGAVRSTLPIEITGKKQRTRLQGRLGSGGEELTLRTSAGAISLASIDGAAATEVEGSSSVIAL